MACSRILGTLMGVLFTASVAGAQVPEGWQKLSGIPETGIYSGVPDGLQPVTGDRENSYAWSMEVLGDYLYVGTNRNAFSLMIGVTGRSDLVDMTGDWTRPVPPPIGGFGARLYRMGLASGAWEQVAVPPGADTGFRMMRTYAARGGPSVLYVGGSGVGSCRLLAVDGTNPPREIFSTSVPGQFLSIRSIAEHDGRLFWATEDQDGPALFASPDPMNHTPDRIPLPAQWQQGGGAEIADLISYNGALYVFFLTKTQNEAEFGFWVAKVRKIGNRWRWTLVVGDRSVDPTARYDAGMGNPENGVAVPFIFQHHVYIGTMDAAAFRLLNNINQPTSGKVWGTFGMEILALRLARSMGTRDAGCQAGHAGRRVAPRVRKSQQQVHVAVRRGQRAALRGDVRRVDGQRAAHVAEAVPTPPPPPYRRPRGMGSISIPPATASGGGASPSTASSTRGTTACAHSRPIRSAATCTWAPPIHSTDARCGGSPPGGGGPGRRPQRPPTGGGSQAQSRRSGRWALSTLN